MKKKMLGVISFLITVAVLIAVVKFMNWLPAAMDKNSIRPYASVEAVKSTLGIDDIAVPSYFPEPLGWPPSKILAQKKPFEAVIMEFEQSGAAETALVIVQADRPGFAHDARLRLTEVVEDIPYSLGQKTARLETGSCSEGSPCSRISWSSDGKNVSLTMKSPPIELIRIAESMSH